jgi:phage gpG-like protein
LIEVIAMKVFSILEFLAEIPAIERDLHASGPKIIEEACKIVQRKAKSTIGKNNYNIGWAPIAESTRADKAKHGYAVPAPLLRTGELRDSIEYTLSHNEGCVGTDDPIAPYQEFGTSRIPPRSFLVSSAIASEDKIRRMATATTIAALSGFGHGARDVREMLHLLHQAGHALYELGEDILNPEDEGSEGNSR